MSHMWGKIGNKERAFGKGHARTSSITQVVCRRDNRRRHLGKIKRKLKSIRYKYIKE